MDFNQPYLIIVATNILGFIILYFNEKIKSKALKEDVEEITKKIEQVKLSFVIESEKLKSNLQLITNIQIGLHSEERNAIVDFNEKYFKFMYLMANYGLPSINQLDNTDLNNHRKNIIDYQNEFIQCTVKFKLFVNNDKLVQDSYSLSAKLLKHFYPPIVEYIVELMFCNKRMNELFKEKGLNPSIVFNSVGYDDIIENINKILEGKRDESLSKVKKKTEESFNILNPLSDEFQKNCKDYLYSLIK